MSHIPITTKAHAAGKKAANVAIDEAVSNGVSKDNSAGLTKPVILGLQEAKTVGELKAFSHGASVIIGRVLSPALDLKTTKLLERIMADYQRAVAKELKI